MTRLATMVLLLSQSAMGACMEMGAASPSAAEDPVESPAFFSVVLDYLARDARGRVLVDPRPLRTGADLRTIEDEDLDPDAAAVTRLRSEALAARGVRTTNATVDQRCTFSEGVGLPPGRQRVVPDSVRRQIAECRAREAYTTFILGLPEPDEGNGYPPGTWRVRVHEMERAGFQVRDLYLRATAHSGWEVFAVERRFGMSA